MVDEKKRCCMECVKYKELQDGPRGGKHGICIISRSMSRRSGYTPICQDFIEKRRILPMVDWSEFKTKKEAVKWLKDNGRATCYKDAVKYMCDNIRKEGYYQDKIIKHIRQLLPQAFVWKATAGAYSQQGIPDICVIVNGRYYGFEVKRPLIGVLSVIQRETIKKIEAAGGKAYVVSYASEVSKFLQDEILGTATNGKSSKPH